MRKQIQFCAAFILLAVAAVSAQKTVAVDAFDKVIISPYIAVNFVEGDTESVTIESSDVSDDKINIEVSGKTLRVYLDGAKDFPKQKKERINGYKRKSPLYRGTQVVATVTYRNVDEYSLRGEEEINLKSPIKQEKLRLKIYGESEITIEELQLEELNTTIYGESELWVKTGSVREQRIVAYGESRVHLYEINNERSRVTAYGEAEFDLNASDQIKVTAFGEAKVNYKGSPEIRKGINLGEVSIRSVD